MGRNGSRQLDEEMEKNEDSGVRAWIECPVLLFYSQRNSSFLSGHGRSRMDLSSFSGSTVLRDDRESGDRTHRPDGRLGRKA